MKITVNEKIDLKADRKKDQFLADMKKARTPNGWEVIEEGWASEGEVKGLYSVYCSEDTELPDVIPDSQMEAIADILREAVSKDPTVCKYSDYIKADAFFDGGIYVNVSFDPTEELWQEELSDAEYVWKKVANAMASIAERYRSKGAELEKQTQGKGESKAAPKKAEATGKKYTSWFEVTGLAEEDVYEAIGDILPNAKEVRTSEGSHGGVLVEVDGQLSAEDVGAVITEFLDDIVDLAVNAVVG